MKIVVVPLVAILLACSQADEPEAKPTDARDVHLSLARIASNPGGPATQFRGTFQGTEPCLYFQDLSRSPVPVAFVSNLRWDPAKKGVVVSGASGKDEMYRPGEAIIVEGWDVSTDSLRDAWAEAPQPICQGARTLVVRTIAHNFVGGGTPSNENAAEK